MKRLFTTLLTTIAIYVPLVLSSPAYAVDVLPGCNDGSKLGSTDVCRSAAPPAGSSGNVIVDDIRIAVEVISWALGIAAVIMIIISGIRLATGGGDSKTAAEARGGIIYALVGIAIAILAQVLVFFVLDNLK